MRLRQRPLKINALELNGKGAQNRLREFIEITLVSEDGMQVRPAPAGRRGVRDGDWQEPRFEGPLRAGADDGRAEADRRDVPFTDGPHAERQPSLASVQTALVGAQHRARVAQGRALRRVLRREARPQQQRARSRQLARLLDVRGDDRRMPPQELLVIAVATAEVADQARSQSLGLVLRQAHDAPDDLAGSRMGSLKLLARQEEPRDDARRIGVQLSVNAVRDHPSSPIRRACCAVASIASVDSAPWLRLRPPRSRPS